MSWFLSHSEISRCFQTVAILGYANMEHLPHPMYTTLQRQSGYTNMPGGEQEPKRGVSQRIVCNDTTSLNTTRRISNHTP